MYLQHGNRLTDIENKFMATKGESVSHSVVSDSLQPHGPGSSVHGILQLKIVEWVAIPFSRGSSQPRD